MQEQRKIETAEILSVAEYELVRLGYRRSAYDRHSKELRQFREYCEGEGVRYYDLETAKAYFKVMYGKDMTAPGEKLSGRELETRCTLQMLNHIYCWGEGKRYGVYGMDTPPVYKDILEEYLGYCVKEGNSAGTLRVKRTKLNFFLQYLENRDILLWNTNESVLSEFMTSLSGYSRATIHIYASVLSSFFEYLRETEKLECTHPLHIPRPKIYIEEGIPETWTVEEVRQLLGAIERTNPIGKRDYAMALLAALLGMRVGDICRLEFTNLDWKQKRITYTQQKTQKVNELPLLAPIGEAIIDYVKNGRPESESSRVFIRHLPPYGEFLSSSALSENLKRYMRQAGMTVTKRKLAHSLRHTLASGLLYEGVPLITISNILGHYCPQTTAGYTKVDIPALRKCALSFGKKEVEA